MKKLFIALSCFALLVSCSSNEKNKADIVINIDDYTEVECDNPADFMGSEPRYICLSNDSDLSFTFENIQKIIIKNGLIYISETGIPGSKKMLIFDLDGNPVHKLDSYGRGPQEYLQISDFDVDEKGNIWVVDGQKDEILKYSPNCELEKALPFMIDIGKICWLPDDRFLCLIASWDSSNYSGSQLAVMDSLFNVQSVISNYPKNKDKNFVFPSNFSPTSKSVFYCDPIEDRLYEVAFDGTLSKTYDFDFGAQKVPDKWKEDIDRNLDQIRNNCKFICGSYRVSSNYISVVVFTSKGISVVINKSEKTISYFDQEISGFELVGQCAEGSIWQLSESDNTASLPENVQKWLSEGLDVIAVIPDE